MNEAETDELNCREFAGGSPQHSSDVVSIGIKKQKT